MSRRRTRRRSCWAPGTMSRNTRCAPRSSTGSISRTRTTCDRSQVRARRRRCRRGRSGGRRRTRRTASRTTRTASYRRRGQSTRRRRLDRRDEQSGATGSGSTCSTRCVGGNSTVLTRQQYLLPVFSNATASRRQASRKALRKSQSRIVLDHVPSSDSLDGDLGNESAVTIGDNPYAQPPRLGSGSRTPRPRSNEHLGFSQMLTQLVSGRDASERGATGGPLTPTYASDKRRPSPPRRPAGGNGGDESSGSAGSTSSAGVAPSRLSVGQRPQRTSADGTLR